VDLPESWTPWSYKVLEESNLVVLVTQLTVAGVRRARRQIDTMMANGLEHVPVKVALNRYEKSWTKNVNLKEAEKALGRPFDFLIPSDFRTVSEALDQGVAFEKVKKKSKVGGGVEKMVDQILKTMAGGESGKAEPRLSFGLRR
jgi:pilus assembly protein CpaE